MHSNSFIRENYVASMVSIKENPVKPNTIDDIADPQIIVGR